MRNGRNKTQEKMLMKSGMILPKAQFGQQLAATL